MLVAGNWHPMCSWFADQPWSRNYGQAPGASKAVRERMIATRDHSRFGAVAADSGAVLRRSSSRRRVGLSANPSANAWMNASMFRDARAT